VCTGTSGWNYKHWHGRFYPSELSREEWLSYYSSCLSSVEINNTFYSLPDGRTFTSWKETVPADFIFSVKASRYISHMKKLKNPQDALKRFFSSVELLGEKCGPVLFQLPPRWKKNTDRLKAFLDLLDPKRRYTFEFRDTSWFSDEVYDALAEKNAAFCIYELAGLLSPKEVTADFVYIRLHGPGEKYQGLYSKETLSGWAGAISSWNRQGRDIFCYFDNDEKGYAAENALMLKQMVNNRE
jgi:uncharacterized protein YecE (DUF72 family)